jgi:hypothetical protein
LLACLLNLDSLLFQKVPAGLARASMMQDIERLIEDERAKGAPLATMIASLDLANSSATLLLDDWLALDDDSDTGDSDDGESDDGGASNATAAAAPKRASKRAPRVRVDIDLTVNAYTNAECAPVLAFDGGTQRRCRPSSDSLAATYTCQGSIVACCIHAQATRQAGVGEDFVNRSGECRYHFDRKKAAAEKRDKTSAANSRALKQVEAKTAQVSVLPVLPMTRFGTLIISYTRSARRTVA